MGFGKIYTIYCFFFTMLKRWRPKRKKFHKPHLCVTSGNIVIHQWKKIISKSLTLIFIIAHGNKFSNSVFERNSQVFFWRWNNILQAQMTYKAVGEKVIRDYTLNWNYPKISLQNAITRDDYRIFVPVLKMQPTILCRWRMNYHPSAHIQSHKTSEFPFATHHCIIEFAIDIFSGHYNLFWKNIIPTWVSVP